MDLGFIRCINTKRDRIQNLGTRTIISGCTLPSCLLRQDSTYYGDNKGRREMENKVRKREMRIKKKNEKREERERKKGKKGKDVTISTKRTKGR